MSTGSDIMNGQRTLDQIAGATEGKLNSLERRNGGIKVRLTHNQSFDIDDVSETVLGEHYSKESHPNEQSLGADATAEVSPRNHDASEKLKQNADPVVEIEVQGLLPKPSPEDDEGWEEDEDDNEEGQTKGLVPRIILSSRKYILICLAYILKKTKGYLLTIVLLLGYFAYVIAAMCYRFNDEGAYRLLACTIVAVIIASRSYIRHGLKVFMKKVTGSSSLTPVWRKRRDAVRFSLRWSVLKNFYLVFWGGGGWIT